MILIIEDSPDEKLGDFLYDLQTNGFDTEIIETLEEAEEFYDKNKNKIEGIILDFAFPTSKTNIADADRTGCPNGIKFLRAKEFSIATSQIPVIINTSADEDYREEWLNKTMRFNSSETNPLLLYKSAGKQSLGEATKAIRQNLIQQLLAAKEKLGIIRTAGGTNQNWRKSIPEWKRPFESPIK